MLDKEQFGRMMVKLARHFRVSDDHLTSDYIDSYYIGLMDFTTIEVARGFRWITENQKEPWFPNIKTVKEAIIRTAPEPTALPEPAIDTEPVSEEQRKRNRYGFEWILMAIFGEVRNLSVEAPPRQSGLRKMSPFGAQSRELNKAELEKYAEYIKEDGDSSETLDQKRRAYVDMKMKENEE